MTKKGDQELKSKRSASQSEISQSVISRTVLLVRRFSRKSKRFFFRKASQHRKVHTPGHSESSHHNDLSLPEKIHLLAPIHKKTPIVKEWIPHEVSNNRDYAAASFIQIGGLLSLMSVMVGACTNSFSPNIANTTIATPNSNPDATVDSNVGVTNSGVDNHVISNVSLNSGEGGSGTETAQIFFDTLRSTAEISNHCNNATSGSVQTSKPCFCQFTWSEVNPNSTSATPVPRTIKTSVVNIQPQLVLCNAPGVFDSEIVNGTKIRVTVIPGPSNPDATAFKVTAFTITKSANVQSGSFQDAQGRVFDNILRYSCYQRFKKGLSITSKTRLETDPETGASSTVVIGSQFCVATVGGGATTDCPANITDFSAQGYYFNLYVRNSERGDINQFNDSFICPLVKESLQSDGSIATQNQPWPLDTSFALSLAPTADFPIGVEANSKLAGGDDPVIGPSTCFPPQGGDSGTTQTDNSSIISSCLGFAARINGDGTCPFIRDSSGQIRQTFRLRRYVTVYPKLFDAAGNPSELPQNVDTIYVLDRPVKGPPNSDPLKPYTMLGPKPCPFAFFNKHKELGIGAFNNDFGATDHSDDRTEHRGYFGSNNDFWRDKNIDGIQFPNYDHLESNPLFPPSCSASFPILSQDKTFFTLTTINKFNERGIKNLWVRPSKPFMPHYEEDTQFQACAPQSSPLIDPPLHFIRQPNFAEDERSINVAWCAEVYPTQNPNIAALDPGITSPADQEVVNYTSHGVKNSASPECQATANLPVPSGYQTNLGSSSAYYHPSDLVVDPGDDQNVLGTGDNITADKTCDRSAINSGLAWPRFPLLAPATDVERIHENTSYQCTITFDAEGGKAGVSTPSTGCCDSQVVSVPTGSDGGRISAHLEPNVPCRVPSY